MLPENVRKLVEGFRQDAHPMGMFLSLMGALSTFYPEAKNISDPQLAPPADGAGDRPGPGHRGVCATATSTGRPFVLPDDDLSYTGNFLNMLFKMTEAALQAAPRPRARARRAVHPARRPRAELQHGDDAQYRQLARRPVFGAGGRRGGALRPAARRRQRGGAAHARHEIGRKENVPAFIKRVKSGEGRLMGFGHRVYKSYDPRAKIIKRIADLVFEVTGKNPLLEMALELERIALEDDYFVSRKLYPNVDFYSGLIYQAMGFPLDMFPVLFAIPRTAGWMAQWEEMLTDPEQKIARPRQIYIGAPHRDYGARDKRR